MNNSIFQSWNFKKLEDVAEVVDSLHKTPFYVDSGYPMVRVTDIKGGFLKLAECKRVTEEVFQEFTKKYLPCKGDILFSRVGTYGMSSYVITEEEFCLGQNTVVIKPKINSRYLYLCLNSPSVKQQIEGFAVGSTQKTISLKSIKSLEIPVSEKQEIETIAHILGTLDDKIELNQQTNQTLEAIARALFKSWFIDFDPVRAKMDGRQPAGMAAETAALFPDDFKDGGAIGKIPKGWKVKKLVEITSKIGSGATPRGGSQVYVDEGVSLIRSQNVYDYQFSWDGLARITEETAEQLRNVTVEPNDILLNITGDSILRTCIVEPSVLPARVNQHVSIIRAVPEIPCRYLHLYLVQPQIKNLLLGFDTGGTRKAVTKGQLESVSVPVPSESVLLRFREITNPLYECINSNLAESRTLASIRDALLPKLLSGEIRIQDAEKAVEAVL